MKSLRDRGLLARTLKRAQALSLMRAARIRCPHARLERAAMRAPVPPSAVTPLAVRAFADAAAFWCLRIGTPASDRPEWPSKRPSYRSCFKLL